MRSGPDTQGMEVLVSGAAPSMKVSTEAKTELDFETVYDRHFDFVWRVLHRLGVAESFVEDAAQDVFVVVHRRLKDFEGGSELKTWLFGIALRVARGHRRRQSRKGGVEPLPEGLQADGVSAEELIRRQEAHSFLSQFMESLDEAKRAVFIMAELEQMTAPEIAKALGVNLNTVYSRLRAARAAFEAAVARRRAALERQEG